MRICLVCRYLGACALVVLALGCIVTRPVWAFGAVGLALLLTRRGRA